MRYSVSILLVSFILSSCSVLGPSSDDLGKRTFGTRLDDSRVESLAIKTIRAADPQLEEAHIDVTSFNGVVLLTGQVPAPELSEQAAEIVSNLRNVKRVHNELEIAGPTSLLARTNDNWLETKIKSSMIASSEVDAGRIEIVAENGVVYLMGLLTRAESDAAVELTRQIYGVQKIIKVFEYIN